MAQVNENFLLLLNYIVICNLEDVNKINTNVLQMNGGETLHKKNVHQ